MTSNTFTITIGGASQLVFSAQPGGGANGVAWGTQPAVSVEDAGGNVVTNATNQITLALGTNPGGTLACTPNPLNANAGVASFAGCKITGKAGTYTLTAAATGLAGATSNTFTISFGAATQIAFDCPARRRSQRRGLGHPAGRERRGRLAATWSPRRTTR